MSRWHLAPQVYRAAVVVRAPQIIQVLYPVITDDFVVSSDTDAQSHRHWSLVLGPTNGAIVEADTNNLRRNAVNDDVVYAWLGGHSVTPDQFAELEVVTTQADHYTGAACRLTGSTTSLNGYVTYIEEAGDSNTYRIDNGSFNLIASGSYAATDGDVVRIDAEGDTIRQVVNGTQQLSTTDANHDRGAVGYALWTAGTSWRCDNFRGGNIGQSGGLSSPSVGSVVGRQARQSHPALQRTYDFRVYQQRKALPAVGFQAATVTSTITATAETATSASSFTVTNPTSGSTLADNRQLQQVRAHRRPLDYTPYRQPRPAKLIAAMVAPFRLYLNSSRTSGTAPLTVHFDTIGTHSPETPKPWNHIRYEWDFDDQHSTHRYTRGPNAGHVFEVPGTYTVECNAYDGVNTIVDTITITVDNPDTTFATTDTICFSNDTDFTGAPSGSTQVTTSSFDTAWTTYFAEGKRLLFKRGDTFSASPSKTIDVQAETQVGAFGPKGPIDKQGIPDNNPVINVSGTGTETLWTFSTFSNRASDFTAFDLQINSTGARKVANHFYRVDRITFLRIEADGWDWPYDFAGSIAQGNGEAPNDVMAWVDCRSNNNNDFAIFCGSYRQIVVGNEFDGSAISHVYRSNRNGNSYYAENYFGGAPSGLHVLKLGGPDRTLDPELYDYHTRRLNIVDNWFDNSTGAGCQWVVAIAPTSSLLDERIVDVVVDGNHTEGGATNFDTSYYCAAQDVIFRNNTLTANKIWEKLVTVTQRGIEPEPDGIEIYNNTVYSDVVSGGSPIMVLDIYDHAPGTLQLKNNILYAPTAFSQLIRDNGGNYNSTNNQHDVDPSFVDQAAGDYRLRSGSTMIGAGTAVPVYTDRDGVRRPVSSTWDVGAHEGVATYSDPARDRNKGDIQKHPRFTQTYDPRFYQQRKTLPVVGFQAAVVTSTIAATAADATSASSFTVTNPPLAYSGERHQRLQLRAHRRPIDYTPYRQPRPAKTVAPLVNPLTVYIDVNRTDGTGPTAVFFDASRTTSPETTKPYHHIRYTWDFDDPTSTHPVARGPSVAHVFEFAGSYTVTLTAFDGVSTVQETVTITVTDFSGANTWCFSNDTDFTGAPAGATQVTTSSFDTAWNTYYASGRRLLFKRGDTFTATGSKDIGTTADSMIGQFGTGGTQDSRGIWSNAPIVSYSTASSDIFSPSTFNSTRAANFICADIEFTTSGTAETVCGIDWPTDNFLFLRVRANGWYTTFDWNGGFSTGNSEPFSEGLFFVDCEMQDTDFFNFFGGANQLAWVGCLIGSGTETGQTIRVQHTENCFISESKLTGTQTAGTHAIKMHNIVNTDPLRAEVHWSDYTERVVLDACEIDQNGVNAAIAILPQDNFLDERQRDIIIQGNHSYGGGFYDYWLSGDDVTCRNNTCDDTTTASNHHMFLVEQRGGGSGPVTANGFEIYNNTVGSDVSSAFTTRILLCNQHGSSPSLQLTNNLIYVDGHTSEISAGSGSVTSTTNLDESSDPFVSLALGDFRLRAGTTPLGYGTDVAVWDDIDGRTRPIDTTWDAGAHEGVATYSDPARDRNKGDIQKHPRFAQTYDFRVYQQRKPVPPTDVQADVVTSTASATAAEVVSASSFTVTNPPVTFVGDRNQRRQLQARARPISRAVYQQRRSVLTDVQAVVVTSTVTATAPAATSASSFQVTTKSPPPPVKRARIQSRHVAMRSGVHL